MHIKRGGEYDKEGRSIIHKIHLRGPNSFVLLLVSTRTTAAVCVFGMDDGASISSGESDQHTVLSS